MQGRLLSLDFFYNINKSLVRAWGIASISTLVTWDEQCQLYKVYVLGEMLIKKVRFQIVLEGGDRCFFLRCQGKEYHKVGAAAW